MSAYRDALHISSAENGARLQLAIELLASHGSVVVLDELLALRPDRDTILCEVIASGNLAPQAQVQNAKRLLESSPLGSSIRGKRCNWLVVEDYGTGTVERWCES